MSESSPPPGCLAWFIGVVQRVIKGESSAATPHATSAPVDLPKVMINRYFISQAECGLLHSLRRVVGDRAHILAQVSLQQLFYFPPDRGDSGGASKAARAHWQNKVRARSIDVLLCDRTTMKPLVAIEYDDRSHEQENRKLRDAEVERLFAAVGLPLLRIKCGRGDDVKSLNELLAPHLTRA